MWVVVDGSTDRFSAPPVGDGSRRTRTCASSCSRRTGARAPRCCIGLREAQAQGYTHVLTMDSDGQHPAERIAQFMRASLASPTRWCWAARCSIRARRGLRVKGRRISNWWANLETLWARHRRLAFRLSRVSDRRADRGDAPAALDAALRLRRGSRGAAVLARRPADQPTGAGALLPARRGRRFALPLLARQRVADLDAHAVVLGLSLAAAAIDRVRRLRGAG